MFSTKVAIVGGGPAGLITGNAIAKKGFRPLIFEQNEEIGKPNHCAGLISLKGLKRIGIKPNPNYIQQKIKGVRLYSPSSECIEILEKNTRALVLDRTGFDKHLANIALDNGATVYTKKQVKEIITKKTGFSCLKLKGYDVNSNIIINAEGATPNSLLPRKDSVKEQKGTLIGVNVELKGIEVEPNIVEVWFNQKLATNFFCWVAPTGDNSARIGLASSRRGVMKKLRKFISIRFKKNKKKISATPPKGGYVLTGGPIHTTFYDSLLLVGDAAGQVKPTTGGGVVLGGLCALSAGKTVVEALEKDVFSSSVLSRYQRRWSTEIGNEIKTMLLARKLLNMINDDEMNKAFNSIKKENLEPIIQELVERGDMDFQGEFIKKSLKNPKLAKLGLKILGVLALDPLNKIVNL